MLTLNGVFFLLHLLFRSILHNTNLQYAHFTDLAITYISTLIHLNFIWFLTLMYISMILIVTQTLKRLWCIPASHMIILTQLSIFISISILHILNDLIPFLIFFEAILFFILIIQFVYTFSNKYLNALLFVIYFSIVSGLACILIITTNLFLFGGFHILSSSNTTLLTGTSLHVVLIFSIFLVFGIKYPIYPFYVWLLTVHVEVSTEASILLAAVVLKAGFIGLLKFLFLPIHSLLGVLTIFMHIVTVMGLLLATIKLLTLLDIKRIIALWSIAHVNIALLSTNLNNISFLYIFILSNLGHILSSTSFFFIFGLLYELRNSKNVLTLHNLPSFNIIQFTIFILCLNNIDFPGFLLFFTEVLQYITFIFINSYLIIILHLILFLLFLSTFGIMLLLNNVNSKFSSNYIRSSSTLTEYFQLTLLQFLAVTLLLTHDILYA